MRATRLGGNLRKRAPERGLATGLTRAVLVRTCGSWGPALGPEGEEREERRAPAGQDGEKALDVGD
eukprot:2593250-Alexandrium_andersonii.AAC.1